MIYVRCANESSINFFDFQNHKSVCLLCPADERRLRCEDRGALQAPRHPEIVRFLCAASVCRIGTSTQGLKLKPRPVKSSRSVHMCRVVFAVVKKKRSLVCFVARIFLPIFPFSCIMVTRNARCETLEILQHVRLPLMLNTPRQGLPQGSRLKLNPCA